MTEKTKDLIKKISQEFADGFKETIGPIAGSAWLIVDPLSGYLNFIGYENNLTQLYATEDHGQILIINFPDGTMFIPAGSELGFNDWMFTDELPTNVKP